MEARPTVAILEHPDDPLEGSLPDGGVLTLNMLAEQILEGGRSIFGVPKAIGEAVNGFGDRGSDTGRFDLQGFEACLGKFKLMLFQSCRVPLCRGRGWAGASEGESEQGRGLNLCWRDTYLCELAERLVCEGSERVHVRVPLRCLQDLHRVLDHRRGQVRQILCMPKDVDGKLHALLLRRDARRLSKDGIMYQYAGFWVHVASQRALAEHCEDAGLQ